MRCGLEAAAIRSEPRDDAEQLTQALRGDPLEVGERRAGWARVTTAYGYPGWIRDEALCGDDAVSLARTFLGAPYEWGGLTAAGIDCSGLVHLAYRLTGQAVPRDAHEQEAAATQVDEATARPGDLVCFGEPGRAHHIAFWLGDGRILHATAREGVDAVVEEPLENVAARPIRFARLTMP